MKKNWITILINGVIAIVIGIILLVVKQDIISITIKYTGFVLSIIAITLLGVSALKKRPWGSLSLASILMLIIGILFIVYPYKITELISKIVGIWAIFTGTFQIINTVKYRRFIPNTLASLINCFFLIALGVIIIFNPSIIANAVTKVIAALLIVSGLWEVFNAFKFKKISSQKD